MKSSAAAETMHPDLSVLISSNEKYLRIQHCLCSMFSELSFQSHVIKNIII